jgi:hypothetical protein
MPRPTERDSMGMKIRKLVKTIWAEDYNRDKEEFTYIDYANGATNFITVRTGENTIDMHQSLFEDYFNAKNDKERQFAIGKIKEYLDKLL